MCGVGISTSIGIGIRIDIGIGWFWFWTYYNVLKLIFFYLVICLYFIRPQGVVYLVWLGAGCDLRVHIGPEISVTARPWFGS